MNVPRMATTPIFANPDDRTIFRTGAYANHYGKGSRRTAVLDRCRKNFMQRSLDQSALNTTVNHIGAKCYRVPGERTVLNGLPAKGLNVFGTKRANHNVLIMF